MLIKQTHSIKKMKAGEVNAPLFDLANAVLRPE